MMTASKPTIEGIAAALTLIDEIVERAFLITAAAPYFTFCDDKKFARLRIDGSTATLRWPESHSGYYDSCTIEEQDVSFPAELLLMTRTETERWTSDQQAKYDLAKKEEEQRFAARRAKDQEAQERALLAQLQRKYQVTGP